MGIKQVLFRFKDEYDDSIQAGIMLENGSVICACCGCVFELEEIEILHVFGYWTGFSEQIMKSVT